MTWLSVPWVSGGTVGKNSYIQRTTDQPIFYQVTQLTVPGPPTPVLVHVMQYPSLPADRDHLARVRQVGGKGFLTEHMQADMRQ